MRRMRATGGAATAARVEGVARHVLRLLEQQQPAPDAPPCRLHHSDLWNRTATRSQLVWKLRGGGSLHWPWLHPRGRRWACQGREHPSDEAGEVAHAGARTLECRRSCL